MARVVVVGQVARDLVLAVAGLPEPGGSTRVSERREVLGGKGANQAVGLRQLGSTAALVGVVGDDGPGREVRRQAEADGIDVGAVAVRGETALLVDVVEPDGTRRLLEHVPHEALLTADDVAAATDVLARADLVLLQLQQPAVAVRAVLGVAAAAGVPVLADGAPEEEVRDEVLAAVRVLRADDVEAALLLGRGPGAPGGAGGPDGVEGTLAAAHELLGRGPELVVLAAGREANVAAWPGGDVVVGRLEAPVTDPTGAGDAFTAGLATALLHDEDPETAAWWGSAAAALTVPRLGGRPGLSLDAVRRRVAEARS